MDKNLRATMNMVEILHDQLVWRANRILKNINDAEDTVQEVSLKLLETNPAFENDTHRKNYLFRAVHNQALSLLEDNKKSIMFTEEWMNAVHQYADEYCFSHETLNWLINTLKEQPPKVVGAFLRYALYKERIKDIAIELDMKPETLRQQIFRLRKKLKKAYLLFMELLSVIRLVFLVT